MDSPFRCLISAGPTREYLDPVRFLSNPSTGKMGLALAEAARDVGWAVDLVLGPTHLPHPPGMTTIPVETGEEMYQAISDRFDACDILIMTAAVTDYRPFERAAHKLKKAGQNLTLEFEPVVDILQTMGARRKNQILVGFAAETRDVETYARGKLEDKNCHFVVGNDVSEAGSGFGVDTNRVLVVPREGPTLPLGPASKQAIARDLVALFRQQLPAR